LVLLGALIVPHAFSLSLGCGPKQGDLGGSCIPSDSCARDPTCHGDLVCSGDKCVEPGPIPLNPAPAESPCDAIASRSPCPLGFEARCLASATPRLEWNGACAATESDDGGTTLFCCDPSRPQCQLLGGENLTPSAPFVDEPWSNCPTGEQSCRGLAAVPVADASVQCAQDIPDDAGWTATCCVAGDACFAWFEGALPGYYPQGACASGEVEYFCTGSARLVSDVCRSLAAPDGGPSTAAPAFCCPTAHTPTVSYGGDGGDGAALAPDASSPSR
jgi:hypothetical protein